MRLRRTQNGLTINAVAGTSAVLLSMDMDESDTDKLLGFYIRRKEGAEGKKEDITSKKFFKEEVANHVPGDEYSTKKHPWQSFLYEDFRVKIGETYSYIVQPVYGTPQALTYGKGCVLDVTIPSAQVGKHSVYFNRGVAGSQAYAKKFGNRRPDQMTASEKKDAMKWLSRGLFEALTGFIRKAKDESYSIRACFYEFEYQPVLNELQAAIDRHVDVKIIYDCRGQAKKNSEAIAEAEFPKRNLIPRKTDDKYIAHNKFMVLLRDDEPVAVWTGSTNITEKGIFGQCNVGHEVRDKDVAEKYLAYWNLLKKDPDNATLCTGTAELQADVASFTDAVTMIFSPRSKKKILDTYASLVANSKQLVCGMFPFSFSKSIKAAVCADTDLLKYILIDKKDKNTTLQTNDVDNVIVYGGVFDDSLNDWVSEVHAGKLFRTGTNFVHNKVILIDPLTDAPIVLSGSANFSDNSIRRNDENTLAIISDKDVADMYFTEFVRIFNHYAARQQTKKLRPANAASGYNPIHLRTISEEWVPAFYKPQSLKSKRRKMFAEMAV